MQFSHVHVHVYTIYTISFKCLTNVASDVEPVYVGGYTYTGCSAVLLEIACGAVEAQWPPEDVPQVCSNNLVFTSQTMLLL